MSRKIAYIMLSAMLIVATAGLAITSHYCGPEFISVSLFEIPDGCCDTEEGCCHTDYTFLQLTKDFTVATILYHPDILPFIDLPGPGHGILPDTATREIFPGASTSEHPPPLPVRVRLSRFQSFLL